MPRAPQTQITCPLCKGHGTVPGRESHTPKVVELRRRGLTYRQIQQVTGLALSTIYHHLGGFGHKK